MTCLLLMKCYLYIDIPPNIGVCCNTDIFNLSYNHLSIFRGSHRDLVKCLNTSYLI